jgi:hypothetical protein
LFHTDAVFFQQAAFLFFRKGAEDEHVFPGGFDQA